MANGKWPDTATLKKGVLAQGKVARNYPDSIETTGGNSFSGRLEPGQVIHGKKLKGGGFRFPMTSGEDTLICDLDAEYVQA